MIEDFKIELIQMMENAGRNLANLAREHFFDGDVQDKEIVVLAGTGGNGGGALVAARRLHIFGARVQVYLSREAGALKPVPAHQLASLERIGLPISSAESVGRAGKPALIIDGIIGYSLRGAPRDGAATLIRWANEQESAILSLDAPSGIDTSAGNIYKPAIRATATMTLALPKIGFRSPSVREYVGDLFLADISVPRELYAGPNLNIQVPNIFAGGDIVRLP